jgi:3-hexulose-6-phosphate synthase
MALLQLAIDTTTIDDALQLVESTHPYFDIAEIGTPLLIEEGLAALESIRARYPDKQYLADTKIADAGHLEASSAFRRGADFVTVLGVADDKTIRGALQAAGEHDGLVMIDMIHVVDLVRRAQQLEQLGAHVICLHTAYDVQASGVDPLVHLQEVRAAVQCRLAIAGGINLQNVPSALDLGADIIVVGGGIATASDSRQAAKRIKETIEAATPHADTA